MARGGRLVVALALANGARHAVALDLEAGLAFDCAPDDGSSFVVDAGVKVEELLASGARVLSVLELVNPSGPRPRKRKRARPASLDTLEDMGAAEAFLGP